MTRVAATGQALRLLNEIQRCVCNRMDCTFNQNLTVDFYFNWL